MVYENDFPICHADAGSTSCYTLKYLRGVSRIYHTIKCKDANKCKDAKIKMLVILNKHSQNQALKKFYFFTTKSIPHYYL